MPKNQFSVWSEIVDHRDEKLQKKVELMNHDIEIIERIFRGDTSKGIHLHKLKGTTPPVYSAYVNDTRRLLFITKGSTLALVDITEHHYDTTHSLQPGVAERFYQKPWDTIKNTLIEYEEITHLPDFTPNPNYVYKKPEKCISYHKKFITLDDDQENALTLEAAPRIILGDPGCGKTTLCSEGIEADLKNPELLADGKYIVYFSQSGELPKKIWQAWVLDHPVAARQPETAQLLFINYTDLLERFGPPNLRGKSVVGKNQFESNMNQRLSNKNFLNQYPFLKTPEFKKLRPTLYHEFQILAVCETREDYVNGKMNANFPKKMRAWVYSEYLRYTKNLSAENKAYDPNLLLWQPEDQPFSRVYHDEALSASPAINHMLSLLTRKNNIIYFCDPNQQNTDNQSNLNGIQNGFGTNPNPMPITKLPITYRLPPTIAHVANELLVIKQNINGGKNEKNQSDQVVCKADEHATPGQLTWVSLDKAEPFIRDLNESDHVYVVITHPEYLEDAKKVFGHRVYVCTIDEARGQEFEEAVFYRVTDPHALKDKTSQQTLLQQVCKILSPLNKDLKSKPNLPKADKANHDFEVYMNNIYIALSRVTRHGYFMEAGNPSKNELHRRLNEAINIAMKGVLVEPPEKPASADDILKKARLDLAEGNTGQAKAGFLKAGKTEEDFEKEKAVLETANQALAESITKTTQSSTSKTKKKINPKRKQLTPPSAPAKQSTTPTIIVNKSSLTSAILAYFNTLENAKKTMAIEANGRAPLLNILENPEWKKELLRILDDKIDNMAKRAQITFNLAMQNIALEDTLSVRGSDDQTHRVPFLHYLMSNHFELMTQCRKHYRAKFLATSESAVYETKHWSDNLKNNLNLITLIGQNDKELFADLLIKRPDFIGCIDWALVCTGSNHLPSSALSNLSLVINESFTRIYALLVEHQAAFLSRVSMVKLFRPIARASKELGESNLFDYLIHSLTGTKLINLIATKIVQSRLFDEIFTDEYLSETVSLDDGTMVFINQRMTLLTRIPIIMTHLIQSRKNSSGFLASLMKATHSSNERIKTFDWSAFSAMLRDGCDNPDVLSALIEHHGDALKAQPETIWHAPITQESELDLPEENYLLMHLIIRRHGNTTIETFFKENCAAAYEKANKTLNQTLFTPQEIMEKLRLSEMIEEGSVPLFSENLRNRSTYPFYSVNYTTYGRGNDPILAHLFIIDEFRHEFLRVFDDITSRSRYDDFLLFIRHNNINQMVHFVIPSTLNPIITIPLIHFLCQTDMGKKIVRRVLKYEPRQLVKAISLTSLTEAMPLIADPTKNQSLLHYLATNDITIFSSICEYSGVLAHASLKFFHHTSTFGSIESNLFGALISPLTVKPISSSRCIKQVTALCHLMEAAPHAKPLKAENALIKNADLEYHVFSTLRHAIPPALMNRFLFLLSSNQTLVRTLTVRYNLPKIQPVPELAQRRIKMSGLLPEEIQRYTRMLNKSDVTLLNQLLDDPNVACLLMQGLGASRPRPLFIYLLENKQLKPYFLETVSRRLKANPGDSLSEIFTKRTLPMLMVVQSHTVPVLFELMQDDLGYGIIETLEQNQKNFYANLDPLIFTSVYYATRYQTHTSLLFIASYQRQASFLSILSQNNPVQKNLSTRSFVETYRLADGTSHSVLSNLLLATTVNENLIADIIYYNHFSIYRETNANDWILKNHVVEPQGPQTSLLDLMLKGRSTLPELCGLMAHYAPDLEQQENLGAYLDDFINHANTPSTVITREGMLGLLYLLTQQDTPSRLTKRMPNGETLLSHLLPNHLFCFVLVISLWSFDFHLDAEHRYVNFFNHVDIQTAVFSQAQNKKMPLLYHLIEEPTITRITTLYENEHSRYYYKKQALIDWLNPFYQFTPGNEESYVSHLDLLLASKRLTSIAGKIIEHHFDEFINHHCNQGYFMARIWVNHTWISRITPFLTEASLHPITTRLLEKNPLPAETLATILALPFKPDTTAKATNFFTYLEQSESGRHLLGAFSQVNDIAQFLSPDLKMRLSNYVPSISKNKPSITQHGMFPRPAPIIAVETAEEAMNVVKSVINIPSKK